VPLDLERELDRLYGVDLAEFVSERTRLASALRKEGRRDEAERVKELRKPSLSVWTVNQLARTQRKEIDLLLDAGHRLAVAQRALLTGGNREEYERASTAERGALARLSQAARGILGEHGSTATIERVTATLRAAAVDTARQDLTRGRLTHDVDLAGFEAFTGIPGNAAKPPKPQRQRSTDHLPEREQAERRMAAKRDEISRARAKLSSAKERERTLAKELRQAEREERTARDEFQRAGRTAERVRAQHQTAADAVEAARTKLEEARRS
jgi:hypothetical protein